MSEAKFMKIGSKRSWPSGWTHPTKGYRVKRSKYAYKGKIIRPRFSREGLGLAIEKKFIDYSVATDAFVNSTAGAEMDPASSVNCLNAVAIGDGECNRDGRQVKSLSVHVRGYVIRTALIAETTPPAGRNVAIYLVWDKQTNGAQFNSEDVMINTSTNVTTMSKAFRNLQFIKRFSILDQAHMDFGRAPFTNEDTGANYDTSGDIQSFEFNATLGHVVNYKNTTAVVASIVDNSYHVMGIASGSGFTIHYNSRYRFAG